MYEIFHTSVINKKACKQSSLVIQQDNFFLAAHREPQIFTKPLKYRGACFTHIIESRRSNCDYVDNSYFSLIAYIEDKGDPIHTKYIARKRDAQAEYLSLVKTGSQSNIQYINFVDPMQARKTHEALMYDVKREVMH